MPEPPLKVLLLAGPIQVRGSSSYTLSLSERLGRYEVNANLVCSNADVLKHCSHQPECLSVYPYLQMPIWRRIVLGALRRDLVHEPPDLIHVQSRDMAWHGLWLARALRVPYVLSVHDYLGPSEHLMYDLDWCRRVITVSDSVRTELLARTHLPEERVCVISSGVDVDQHTEMLPVLDPGHVPVVGTACPLEAVKGLPFFLGAAQRVLEHKADAEFLIAGAGPEEASLRRLAHSLGIVRHVTFVPNVAEFAEALSAMDVFCLPSLRQGLGTVMLQAMAMGKPVIATSAGGVHRVLCDNQNGLLVAPSNSRMLAERILELLDEPERARMIGEAGRNLVRAEFSVEAMLRRTVDSYWSCVNGGAINGVHGESAGNPLPRRNSSAQK